MNLEDYIKKKNFKPLTQREIENGKSNLKIYGTQEPMPWTTIFARIESGQDIEEIGKQYGHARKIALFAQLHGVEANEEMQAFVETEAKQREQIQEIANEHGTEVATTLLQRVNEIAPDFSKQVATFADKLVKKAISKLDDKYLEAADMLSMAKAVQTSTDTVGLTQRHATAANITAGKIDVQGFSFVLDAPPPATPIETDVIEANVEEKDND